MADAGSGGGGRTIIPCSEDARPPRDVNGEACSSLVGVFLRLSPEAKLPRDSNGDGLDGHGVGASSESMDLISCSADNGAVRDSPAVGRLELLLGVPTRRDILSRPSWQARNANGILEGDSSNQGEHQEGQFHMPIAKKNPTVLPRPERSPLSQPFGTVNPSRRRPPGCSIIFSRRMLVLLRGVYPVPTVLICMYLPPEPFLLSLPRYVPGFTVHHS